MFTSAGSRNSAAPAIPPSRHRDDERECRERDRQGRGDRPDEEPFPQAVTTARYWTVEGMSVLLERAGFSVVNSEARVQDGRRPHASISAVAV